jgi:hypothetical protein
MFWTPIRKSSLTKCSLPLSSLHQIQTTNSSTVASTTLSSCSVLDLFFICCALSQTASCQTCRTSALTIVWSESFSQKVKIPKTTWNLSKITTWTKASTRKCSTAALTNELVSITLGSSTGLPNPASSAAVVANWPEKINFSKKPRWSYTQRSIYSKS